MCYQYLGLVIIPRRVILSIYPPPPYTLSYRNICFSFSFLVKDKNSYFPVVITYILSGKKQTKGRAFRNISRANSVLWLVQIQCMWQITGLWLAAIQGDRKTRRKLWDEKAKLKNIHYVVKAPKHIVSKELIMAGNVRQLIIIINFNGKWWNIEYSMSPSPPLTF